MTQDIIIDIADNGYMITGSDYKEITTDSLASAYFGKMLEGEIKHYAEANDLGRVKVTLTLEKV